MTGLRVEYLEKHRALSVILRSNSVMPEGVAKHICRRHGSALRVAFISLDYSEGPFRVEEFFHELPLTLERNLLGEPPGILPGTPGEPVANRYQYAVNHLPYPHRIDGPV